MKFVLHGIAWQLIDGEHAPNDLGPITSLIVRPRQGDHAPIKQLLDTGVQTPLTQCLKLPNWPPKRFGLRDYCSEDPEQLLRNQDSVETGHPEFRIFPN